MAAIWTIEEEGKEIATLADAGNTYYLLDNLLLAPQSKIGYCQACLKAYLADRTEPPRCLHCGGTRVTSLDMNAEYSGINPVTGSRYQISMKGIACLTCTAPIFLTKDGSRLDLSPEKSAILEKRAQGRSVAYLNPPKTIG